MLMVLHQFKMMMIGSGGKRVSISTSNIWMFLDRMKLTSDQLRDRKIIVHSECQRTSASHFAKVTAERWMGRPF